jgi:transcriptional regulator with XRE-family HTH domain/Zn-dependent peptidase ImmA (M78 family)
MQSQRKQTENGIGARIRALRKERGLKQTALAAEAGMSASQLCHVEQGLGVPSLKTLERIASALQTTAAGLLAAGDGSGGATSPPALPAGEETDAAGDALSSDALGNAAAWKDGAAASGAASGARRTRDAEGRRRDRETGLLLVHDPRDLPVDRRARSRLAKEIKEWKAAERAAGVPVAPTLPLLHPAAEFGTLLAREMRTAGGLGPAAIVDPPAFFASKGIRVLETKLPAKIHSWALWDDGDGNAFVFVRKDATSEKKRFRTAYEMGHVARFLSGGMQPVRDNAASRKISRAFAASFLMPEEAVRETAHRLAATPDGWTWELVLLAKERFGVSAETFLYRAEELGLLPRAKGREFRARLKAHYAACRAEGREDFEPHLPRRVSGPLATLRFLGQLREAASPPPATPRMKSWSGLQKHAAVATGKSGLRPGRTFAIPAATERSPIKQPRNFANRSNSR